MGGNQSESSVSAAGGIRAISGKNGGEESTTEHTERPKAVTEYTESVGNIGQGSEFLCLQCAAKRLLCVPW